MLGLAHSPGGTSAACGLLPLRAGPLLLHDRGSGGTVRRVSQPRDAMCLCSALRWAFHLAAVGCLVPANVLAWSAPEGIAPCVHSGRLGPIGRRERRRLTVHLHRQWGRDPPMRNSHTCLVALHRRPRCLFHQQRRTWGQHQPRKPRWHGWPFRGCRVGEASNPGPPAPGTPLGGERASQRRRDRSLSPEAMAVDGVGAACRLYCPVPGCPSSDATRAQGWTNRQTLISHVDSHLAGTLQGHVPPQWFRDHHRQRCSVCGLSISTRYGVHPTCQPAARAALGGGAARPAAAAQGLPTPNELHNARGRTLRHIPAAARFLWGQALSRAVAAVVHHNDLRAWTELLILPHGVLVAPPRTGRRHRRAAAAYTVDRLRRWSEGERRSLWDDAPRPARGQTKPLSEEQKRELALDLAREGFDRKACNALLQSGLCPETADTVAALRALHPAQPTPAADLSSLPLADDISEDTVARALRNFPADTAPGPSGLRIQHLREAGPPGTAHSVVTHLAQLVNLMAQGQACPLIAPTLAGAGLVAVPKPAGGVRPITGEILRRLTAECLM